MEREIGKPAGAGGCGKCIRAHGGSCWYHAEAARARRAGEAVERFCGTRIPDGPKWDSKERSFRTHERVEWYREEAARSRRAGEAMERFFAGPIPTGPKCDPRELRF